MTKKTDEHIETKLVWKAKQYDLPTDFAFYFKDLSDDVQASFPFQINVGASGKPGLLSTTRTEEWTLICTCEVVGRDKRGITGLHFDDIKQIFSAEIGPSLKHQFVDLKSIKPKSEWSEITISRPKRPFTCLLCQQWLRSFLSMEYFANGEAVEFRLVRRTFTY